LRELSFTAFNDHTLMKNKIYLSATNAAKLNSWVQSQVR